MTHENEMKMTAASDSVAISALNSLGTSNDTGLKREKDRDIEYAYIGREREYLGRENFLAQLEMIFSYLIVAVKLR